MKNRQELAAEIVVTCVVFSALFTLGVIGVSFINWLGQGYGFSTGATKHIAYVWAIQLGAISVVINARFTTKHKS